MKAVINYCLNPEKTNTDENAHAVSGQNCTPKFACQEFMTNKAVWNKEKGLCFRHYVQSFHPDEKITPDLANEIGLEFAKRAWPGYGVLVATHSDRDHIHNHFVIDTVHTETGKKLHENKQNMQRLRKNQRRTLRGTSSFCTHTLRERTNEIYFFKGIPLGSKTRELEIPFTRVYQVRNGALRFARRIYFTNEEYGLRRSLGAR